MHRSDQKKLDEEEVTLLTDATTLTHEHQRWDVRILLIITLATLNVLLLVVLRLSVTQHHEKHREEYVLPGNIAMVEPLPLKPVKFHWYTPYSSENDTEANVLWDNINTAHGTLAVDHQWAAEHQWNRSMSIPGDESKGMYLLESYHQLHCLKIVRTCFLESMNDLPLSYPAKHVKHCFDYFRQFIMCHADNTPLYTLGEHTSGDGQVHMCKDWSALRDYATENSACFKDRTGTETLREQFGHCDGGIDGLEGVQEEG